MKIPHITRWITVLALFALALAPTAAQEETSTPLLDMLALVPDNAATQEASPVVSYADYRVLEAMRGITNAPLRSLDDLKTETGGLWIAATMGLGAGIQLNYLPNYLEGMTEVVGFAFADIDRSLEFGTPPSMGTLLGGNFDPDAIATAYTARNFTETTLGDVPVWCGPDGCDQGQMMNIRGRNPANPFGGDFGRNEPLALLPGYLADSADFGIVESIISAYHDETPSLADNPAYTSLAEASGAAGSVAQILVMNYSDVGVFEGEFMPEIPDELRAAIANYGTLPPYTAFALANVWDGGSQEITLLMLAYPEAAQAATAAAEISQRLATYVSLIQANRPLLDLLNERGSAIGESYVYESEAGYAVAVVPISAPVPSNERQETRPAYLPSGLVFRLFVQALYSRDLAFIASEITLPE